MMVGFDGIAVLLASLLAVNALLKLKTLKGPLDFDTSNHLYYAFLRRRGVRFLSSYRFGVKGFLTRV